MKLFLTICLCAAAGFAVDFKTFETMALQNAPAMQAARLENNAAKLQGRIALRYANPSIEGEVSGFDADAGGSDTGWRTAISQPVRVFGLGHDLQRYADRLNILAEKGYEKGRAGFMVQLRHRYVDYVKAVHAKALLEQKIALAKRLETIAQERFENGAGTRAKVMQASLQRIAAETKLIEGQREIVARYYDLLADAGMTEQVTLDAAFLYPVEVDNHADTALKNPELQAMQALSNLYEAEAKTHDRSIKAYQLFAEYEEEPDQSIARFGVGIDLPLFNRNKEEYQLARIRVQQASLRVAQLKSEQKAQLESLQLQLATLGKHYAALKQRLEKEQELLSLFEEGYRAAQSSLLDLIQTKNALIDTKRQLLETEYLANLYHIQIDYLKGKLK
ncbi:TolC family protein [Hydrogenimonas cancrithermarum]|uniref:Outer membrane efflux protein n=1 Tax=Hydrogenimonas cancrithermarum TaxID=2993563 RepID=A0ABM8FMU6_9BACT|nr:TolC family protein [Hydrogenimonas cancrithermarum]BDY13723.1 hypothetical protein HCR_20350 [Hydrogenimonas cancrithermarum]